MPALLSGDPLDVFRGLYCAALAVLALARAPHDSYFLRHRREARALPRLLGVWEMPRLSAGPWLVVCLVFVVTLAGANLGVAPAPLLTIACLCALFHFAQLADSPAVHRKANTVPVILALLAAAAVPTGVEPATVSNVTRMVIKLLVAQIYFSAGVAKLRGSGWRWSDGETLRRWLAYYHLRDGSPLTLKLAGAPALCRAAATLTLVFELSFWLVIPFPILAWIYLPAALAFHLATARLLKIHYWLYLGPAYLVFAAEWLSAQR